MGNIMSNINPCDLIEVNRVLKNKIKDYETNVSRLEKLHNDKLKEINILKHEYTESKYVLKKLDNDYEKIKKERDNLKVNLNNIQNLYNNLDNEYLF